jgi:hypothetical protein
VNVVLINLILWPTLALIAVPLLVHLFARARPPVFHFASVEFIRRALRFTQRVRKPKDWLLLALRTAAVAAVILLFLRPVLFSHGGGLFVRRNVVIILDASASMGWSDGSQTRFAVACAEASEIMAGLSTRDAANVIVAGAAPRAVLPAMGGNIGYLQGEVRRARLTAEALDPDAALRLAVRMLNGQEGRKEICVVSDFQASNWRGVKPLLPPDVGLTCVSAAQGDAPNAALVRVTLDPARPLLGEEASILCEVANYSGLPQRKTVVLSMESARVSREAVLPPWGRATVLFRQRIETVEAFSLRATLAEDGFPADDNRWAVVEPTEVLRVGIVASGKGSATAAAWARGCRALGWARPEMLTGEMLSRPEPGADVLMLAGWDGAEPERVRRWIDAGVPVVCYPADGVSMARLAALVTNAVAEADARGVTVWEERPEGMGLRVAAPDHPVMRAFGGGEFGDPARGRVRGRLVLNGAGLPAGTPLLAYADGVPAIWWCSGGRPLVLWTLPLDAERSSVQNQGEFVPFLGELLLEARRGVPGQLSALRESAPGQSLTWRVGLAARAEELLSLKGPDDVVLPAKRVEAVGGVWMSERIERPGVYAWVAGERMLRREAVNFPAAESDLRALSGDEVKGMGALSATSGRAVREWQAGIALWPAFLWIGLALLIGEGAVAAWAAGGGGTGWKAGRATKSGAVSGEGP